VFHRRISDLTDAHQLPQRTVWPTELDFVVEQAGYGLDHFCVGRGVSVRIAAAGAAVIHTLLSSVRSTERLRPTACGRL